MSFFSNFILALKFAKEIMFKYKEATKEEATTQESLYYLFLILLIPSALSTIFLYLTTSLDGNPIFEILGLLTYPFVFLPTLFFLTVAFAMVGLILLAGFMHILAKMLRLIQGNYSNTLAALVYGATPGIMISWLTIPLGLVFSSLGEGIIGIASFIWGVTIGVTALENQHKIGAGRALFVYFLPIITIAIVAAVLILTVLTPAVLSSLSFSRLGQAGTESVPTPQEEFIGLSSKYIELIDASCAAGSAYYVSVRSHDQTNEIDTSDIVLEVDAQVVSEVSWEPSMISAGGLATATVSEFVGEPGSAHRVKAIGPNGQPQQLVVLC